MELETECNYLCHNIVSVLEEVNQMTGVACERNERERVVAGSWTLKAKFVERREKIVWMTTREE